MSNNRQQRDINNTEEFFSVIAPEHNGFSPAVSDEEGGDLSLNWVPVLLSVHSLHGKAQVPLAAGSFMGIYRPDYWNHPLGMIASGTSYKPVNHTDSAHAVNSCGAKITFLGAKIECWGHHIVHAWSLDLIGRKNENGEIEPHIVAGMPVSAILNLVHDHTGTGAIYASVVLYLGEGGNTKVLGAVTSIRKIHKGEGKKRVGVGSNARWTDLIAAICEQVIIAQDTVVELLTLASKTILNEDSAKAFRDEGIFVASEEMELPDGKKKEVFPAVSLLSVIAEHHESRRGDVKWGVWEKRLQLDALRSLDEVLHPGMTKTPLQLALKWKAF